MSTFRMPDSYYEPPFEDESFHNEECSYWASEDCDCNGEIDLEPDWDAIAEAREEARLDRELNDSFYD